MRCELRASGVAIAGRTDLRALLALIDACAMTVGEPSGPVWLAAALGCSTVGIAPKLECSLGALVTYAPEHHAEHFTILRGREAPAPESLAAFVDEKLRLRESSGQGLDRPGLSQQTVVLCGAGRGCICR